MQWKFVIGRQEEALAVEESTGCARAHFVKREEENGASMFAGLYQCNGASATTEAQVRG